MTLFYVLHADNITGPLARNTEAIRSLLLRPALLNPYRLVAVVSAFDLEDVFRVTNHIDREWQANPQVIGCTWTARSTSVGDVAVDPAGQVYLCQNVGWMPVFGVNIRFALDGVWNTTHQIELLTNQGTLTPFPGKDLAVVADVSITWN